MKKIILLIIVATFTLTFTSCYTGKTCLNCGCGVWYPKKFNK